MQDHAIKERAANAWDARRLICLIPTMAVWHLSQAVFVLMHCTAEAISDSLPMHPGGFGGMTLWFAPIGNMIIVFPLMIALLHWLENRHRKMNEIRWTPVVLTFLFACLIHTGGTMLFWHWMSLNGNREVTPTSLMGNALLFAMLALLIVWKLRQRPKHQ